MRGRLRIQLSLQRVYAGFSVNVYTGFNYSSSQQELGTHEDSQVGLDGDTLGVSHAFPCAPDRFRTAIFHGQHSAHITYSRMRMKRNVRSHFAGMTAAKTTSHQ